LTNVGPKFGNFFDLKFPFLSENQKIENRLDSSLEEIFKIYVLSKPRVFYKEEKKLGREIKLQYTIIIYIKYTLGPFSVVPDIDISTLRVSPLLYKVVFSWTFLDAPIQKHFLMMN